jgi:putative selenium metabolism hydrolase
MMANEISVALIHEKAKAYRSAMTGYLRELIAIPSPSGKEERIVRRVEQEMQNAGFDEILIDDFGSVVGRLGSRGPRIVFDSHLDTVGVSDPAAWNFDPYGGKVEGDAVWGRGAADNKAATASQLYAARMIRELIPGNELPFTLFMVGSVQEEDCDGLALGRLITHTLNHVDCVVLGECTNCQIYRGHRGRTELLVETRGVSCHASNPDRGENAIYKMAPLIREIEQLDTKLGTDPFLGKGSIAITKIECDTDSLNCVPSACRIYIDRRITRNDSRGEVIEQLRRLPSASQAHISILRREITSWTGRNLEKDQYFPAWALDESHELVQRACKTYEWLFDAPARVGKWIFSTNGVATMGELGIPTIGFGPGEEQFSHSAQDHVPIDHLTRAAAFYAAFPFVYSRAIAARS